MTDFSEHFDESLCEKSRDDMLAYGQMGKIVFVFPGVGSQYVGMGKVFFDNFPVFRQTFAQASDILAQDLSALCLEDQRKDELFKLDNAQLIVLTFSTAVFRVYMQEIGIPPQFCMGHSLGEYSALCCAGVFSFQAALELVRRRGQIIGEVSAALDGTMMWVINLEQEKVENICQEVSKENQEVYISAYDSPTQTSISGRSRSLLTAAKKLESLGAIVFPLKLSGPFHSPLMARAAREMRAALQDHEYQAPLYPVIANRSAQPYQGKGSVIDNLSLQLVSPIRWRDSVEYVLHQGIETAVEIGPKDVLKFLLRKNTDRIQSFAIDNEADWQALKERFLIPEAEYLKVIGRCLGAAVSTRNRNDDQEDYEHKVAKPYNRAAALYEGLKSSGKSPSREQVREALVLLRTVLDGKKVPEHEQQRQLKGVLGSRVLN